MSENNPYNSAEDGQIRLQILDKLQHHPAIDASKIEVEVRDGVAILKGKSDTENEKQLSEKMTASVAGVTAVENHLVIEVGIAHALSSLAARIQGNIIKDDEDE
ncbi:MAG TPA: BON domain-containing protein [Chitinophagaceae bacterium]|nr:BON domain-containing protein [Chitinophagaceae bacterium]HUM65528.1 BON domain-containing protein [Chitinophagaceae bacterium]